MTEQFSDTRTKLKIGFRQFSWQETHIIVAIALHDFFCLTNDTKAKQEEIEENPCVI